MTFVSSSFQIKEMMERAGNSHLLTILSYPNTGHLIEPPYTPHIRASAFKAVNTREKCKFTFRQGGCRQKLSDIEVKMPKIRTSVKSFDGCFSFLSSLQCWLCGAERRWHILALRRTPGGRRWSFWGRVCTAQNLLQLHLPTCNQGNS